MPLNNYYKLNLFRARKLKDKYLVTTNNGSFVDLSENEYRNLTHKNFNKQLFKKLENSGVIITQKNEYGVIAKFREKNSFLFQGTCLHIVVVTLRCNLICSYCQTSSKPSDESIFDMDTKTAKKVVDFIFQSPSDYISIEFQGGEPLLNFSVIKFIVNYANKLNIIHKKSLRFNIVTNLTLMSDDILDYLFNNNIGICTSLDGPKYLHNLKRKHINGKGSYKSIAKWVPIIKNKKESSKKYPHFNSALLTVHKDSLKYYKEIIDEYIKLGFPKIKLRFITKLGFAKERWSELGYSAEEFLEFYRKSIEYIIKNNIPLSDKMTTIVLRKILTNHDPGYMDLRSPCGVAIGQLAYNYDGSIYPCDEGRMVGGVFKIGNIDQSYNEIISSQKTRKLVDSSVNDNSICNNCVYKPYCGLCPVCSYAENNTITSKHLPDMRCKIFFGIFDYIFEKLLFDEQYTKVFIKWLEKEGVKKPEINWGKV